MTPLRDNPISPTLDFERDGVQHGYLKLPYSRDDSAWGAVMIPVTVVKNGSGPTALLTGGNHGDEYEGPLRQSWPHRQDTPRPESPELDEELWGLDRPAVVDEAETERARQAGGREYYANWAHMHVEHYRKGTMTWDELLDELRSEGPQ